MKIICDIFGKYSKSDMTCTNCGSVIVSEDEIPHLALPVRWGWASFRFDMDSLLLKEEAINYLREKWIALEEFTVMHLLNSQVSRFRSDVNEIKVMVREDFFSSISQNVSNKFEGVSAEFEPTYFFDNAEDVNRLLNEELNKK
ncbi:hypothetical protein [Undibacterium sp. Ji49W]|uniref:hypothetical protein n=1 Tax=Undibacterium sp. Ji49W TaxID=3413040 RepID=UPI003BF034E6